ncbi:alpha-galactosidase-like [Prosopis cineraria]|uniref:alpha-galactosidase-like n=1 Tax=Prosopis cineraria TaxID=364024 RepID=UPI00241012E3|nr:alpha-galactosidase-like [Prosopis cineraria]
MYESWGVDFVKLDCVFGDHYNVDEITAVSEIINGSPRPIVLSVSPGATTTTEMGTDVSLMVNMYRVTPNNKDQWGILKNQFDIARDFAAVGLIGLEGLLGNTWPDLDVLPFGWLAVPDSKDGAQRRSNLTATEERTEMTLWSMAKSPLMIGGDLTKLDFRTFLLLTNPTLLEINSHSSNNMEYHSDAAGVRSWIATGRNGEIYVALFNLKDGPIDINLNVSYIGTVIPEKHFSNCNGSDLWNSRNTIVNGGSKARLGGHSCALFVLSCS